MLRLGNDKPWGARELFPVTLSPGVVKITVADFRYWSENPWGPISVTSHAEIFIWDALPPSPGQKESFSERCPLKVLFRGPPAMSGNWPYLRKRVLVEKLPQ
ncbi:hypothetical protein TNCT_236261 [Trichonephila clavata]|uniref:Uncharacterized protein n=1 Tax=Trichonephila clavata TaxID=2740835 RepID=A0A8X6IHN6_TRICU|nr:hypothetical protein TNCT_236261 [Trichonephila clavata]